MKIMHINAVYGVGSTGIIVEDLHNLALSKGIESHVVYSTSPISAEKIINGYKVDSFISKKVHAVLCRIGGKQGYFSHNETRKLIKHIDKVKPDIIHLHNLHSNYINVNMLCEYIADNNISTVITLHDCWFFTGGCFYYENANCTKWLDGCGNCPKRYLEIPAYIKDCSTKILADRRKYVGNIKDLTAVGVSNWIADEARKSFLGKKNVCTIYNGIDTDWFVNTPSDFREKYGLQDKFVILGAANKWLKPENSETLNYVTENLPEDCALVIIGCIKDDKEKLPKSVVALDYITDRDELRKIYSACDVFANCTREDTLSLINIEPQLCGTPSVTYDNTGVRETVDNKCGFSVPTGDSKAFLETLLKVKENGKAKYSADCVEWAKTKFDRNKNYELYIDLYNSIANKGE